MSKCDILLEKWEKRDPVAPRPSCAERLHARRQLTAILPGYWQEFTLPDRSRVRVTRTLHWDEYRYRIEYVQITLDEATDVILGKADWRKYYTAGIERAKPPREFPTAINYNEPIATVCLTLPLEAA